MTFIKPKEWDDIHATFYWYIHLDPSHPANTTEMLTGYSKKTNQSEAADKVQMLKRKICNLANNGYLKRIKRIEIKQRVGEFIDKKNDPTIIILEPRSYNIPELNFPVIFKQYGQFLKDLYSLVNANKPLDKLLPPAKRGMSADQFLDPSLRKHPTPAHLLTYGSNLLRNGHAPGAVNTYISTVKSMNNWE